MDFKRIEFIFLCAFLSLNLFLCYSYYQGKINQAQNTEVNSVATIETRLTSDKISFPKKLSEDISEGYYLSAAATDFTEIEHDYTPKESQNKYTFGMAFSTPEKMSNKLSDKEWLSFIKENPQIALGKDYKSVHKLTDNKEVRTFSQIYEELPFNDETSELVLEEVEESKGSLLVTGFMQSHLSEIEPLREKQELITEKEAIDTLYMGNKIPYEGSILQTQLAYTRIFTIRGKNVYVPAWFVLIKDNKKNVHMERVNAFANSIISPNVSEVKK